MKIAKIWSCETRESFAKHGSIFASFVFRENPEKSFVKNPNCSRWSRVHIDPTLHLYEGFLTQKNWITYKATHLGQRFDGR